jgi:hypothetical protein
MFTPDFIVEILASATIVVAVTQAIKKWVKVEGILALIISGIVTIIVVLWKTLSVEPPDWPRFIILVIAVFLNQYLEQMG